MASFMRQAYIRRFRGSQGAVPVGCVKTGRIRPQNANDHEQRARVHPAQPSYSVVVPAPEPLSIDVAVECKIGTIATFRKGLPNQPYALSLLRDLPDHRPPDRRWTGRRLLRLALLNLFCGLTKWSHWPIGERDRQHRRRDDCT